MKTIQFPASTGQLARALGVTEAVLADCVRRGKVNPPPEVLAGRRLWQREHAEQVEAHLQRRKR